MEMKTESKVIYSNRKGKIIRKVNSYGMTKYYLYNKKDIFQKELKAPFLVSDYL